ncbi:MAG: CocE/NonD family hydrolase [Cyanobacteria bacterium]|nr:CocE/NonD family hydrolase [Cyanobacteriota bacterium]MDW8201015.1 CocE/NonD family hydrolase [Cyanobacteriota bacterium SKYGB_h_bin112]
MTSVIKETVTMLTRDGVRLDADLYRPAVTGEYPVLLMRQPYGRAIASTVVYAHPTWYAAHGYIVVIQDVRGRGTSQGSFQLFTHEIDDGYDTVNWAAQLPGSNGQVGMYGFSYQGMTQLYAAVHRPTALKTLCPAMIGYDLYADWAYEGGAFCLQANLSWALQLAVETARLADDEATYLKLLAATRNLPLHDPIPALPDIMTQLAQDSFYHDWLREPPDSAYWQRLSPSKLLQGVDLPMLHIGGWFDTFLRGTLNLYQAMASRSHYRQQLVVGPWSHLPWGRKVGAMDYGTLATSQIDRLQLRWFDQFLKGIDTGLLTEPSIALFEMGSNQWCTFDQWPAQASDSHYLASTGLAAIDTNDGKLDDKAVHGAVSDMIVHDPWRPVPALGGHAASPAGSYDRSAIDCRSDVLTYTTPPLETELHLLGTPVAELYCTTDSPSFDLCAVLSEVYPNGAVYNVSQGYVRVEDGRSLVHITLQPTCVCLAAGHALRLSISAACFPAYPVNAGTGKPLSESRLIDARIITVTIHSSSTTPSRLILPKTEDHLESRRLLSQ